MTDNIIPIDLGGVNCYLVRAGDGFILVDTGIAMRRANLEKALESAGCRPGNLKLIVITHGDIDHVDNAAYLREKYGAKIAMHAADAGMVEGGDMGAGRKAKPDKVTPVFGIMMAMMRLFGPRPGQFTRFKPDVYVEDGQDLSEYGCQAKVLHLPGHSKGSVGVLTAQGGLICGDLFYNFPGFGLVDDAAAHAASVNRLKAYPIQTIYPGHGRPCPVGKFVKA
jgi:glyoxylase-like metal-dependent hydrolase (beta-lactamase superfamily II)